MGRQPGSRNRGYFYRAGHGWFTKIDGSFVALTDPEGERIRSKATPIAEIKAAYARIIAAPVEPVNSPAEGTTIQDVCNALDQAKAEGSGKTYGSAPTPCSISVMGSRPDSATSAATLWANTIVGPGFPAWVAATILRSPAGL
jgi:hypothetical protein